MMFILLYVLFIMDRINNLQCINYVRIIDNRQAAVRGTDQCFGHAGIGATLQACRGRQSAQLLHLMSKRS